MTAQTQPLSAKPPVSVIVTTYNVARFLRETLDCLLAQTFKDFELLVVDDGSTDKTIEIIQQYAARDARIVPVILGKNSIGGVATAANAGLDHAKGDYVLFADGDDIYDKAFVGALYASVSDYDADFGICSYDDFWNDSNDVTNPSDLHLWNSLPPEDFFILSKTDRSTVLKLSPVPWRKIYKRAFLEKFNIRYPVVDRFFEDNPFHWNVVMAAETMTVVRKTLCHHRMNRPGQTMTAGNVKSYDLLDHFPDVAATLATRPTENYRPDALRWLLSNIQWIASINHRKSFKLLFEKAKPQLSQFSREEIAAWYKLGLVSKFEILQIASVLHGDVMSFRRALVHRSRNWFKEIRYLSHYIGFARAVKTVNHDRKRFKFRIRKVQQEVMENRYRLDHLNRRIDHEAKTIDVLRALDQAQA